MTHYCDDSPPQTCCFPHKCLNHLLHFTGCTKYLPGVIHCCPLYVRMCHYRSAHTSFSIFTQSNANLMPTCHNSRSKLHNSINASPWCPFGIDGHHMSERTHVPRCPFLDSDLSQQGVPGVHSVSMDGHPALRPFV